MFLIESGAQNFE